MQGDLTCLLMVSSEAQRAERIALRLAAPWSRRGASLHVCTAVKRRDTVCAFGGGAGEAE